MAPSKLAILSIFLALIFSQIRAETCVTWEQHFPVPPPKEKPGSPDSLVTKVNSKFTKVKDKCNDELSLVFNRGGKKEQKKNEQRNPASPESGITKNNELIKEKEIVIQQNSDRISPLEFEIKKNNELIKEKEKVIQQNSDRISSMELQLKKNNELIKEGEKVIQQHSDRISSLRSEIESLQKNGSLVEQQAGKAQARADELEKKVNELKKELQLQRKEKEDLKVRVNEAEVNELEKELQSQRNEKEDLKARVNEAEKKIDELRSKIENVEMWKAKFEATLKAKELNEKWIPAIKEQWVVVKDTVELHVISLSTKTIEVYEVSKTTLAPHVIKAQEVVDLYFQEAKKFSKPYVDQVTTVTKPHVDKIRVVLKPYTKKAVIAYEKFLKSASTYRHQVQGTVKDLLKRHELTRPLATKELEWFAASALLALLIIILFRIFSSLFCTKTEKHVRGTNHARRKAKRGHPEK